ncbi:hypothetical protein ATO6_17580 [Oceanicola sp. 22II-s10i]|uniref:nuclear transport factor 2 family protein n=1 Tax=Oceanicola sp. 22II-s10i TaxID=1317116 RepID=UPI000B524BB4|nr:nuclear transport factor 2 family protein [Oceanicola sp. 22II-s10i]OWU83672.1 hypothetical protein ATO6_17580 [Oceanicola sp. 22II-s10i]
MTDPQAFAAEWEAAWNSHDLDRILAHYHPDIVFRSRKAAVLTGDGEVRGTAALRDYWGKALAAQPDLRFRVVDVFEGWRMLVLSYENHRGVMAAEALWFDADGMVVQAAGCQQGAVQIG